MAKKEQNIWTPSGSKQCQRTSNQVRDDAVDLQETDRENKYKARAKNASSSPWGTSVDKGGIRTLEATPLRTMV